MHIRAEEPADRDAILGVHAAAFGDHAGVVRDLVTALRGSGTGETLSLVACERDAVIGHVMFTPALLDAPRRLVGVQVLSPVGVLPERQRRGVGTALIRTGLTALEDRGVPAVFLEGDPGYYSRLGFRPGRELGFRRPSLRIPHAAFQVLLLRAYEPWMTGTFVYSQTFWDLDAVGLRDDA